jgi:CMP-N,N'-diacetyllegionaminic acid synthase
MTKHKAIALQTARNGSQGVKKKNVMPLGGKPLFLHNLIHLSKSKYVGSVYFSTDIPEAGKYSEQHGFKIIDRPEELCSSTCSHYDVMLHGANEILKEEDFEYIVITLGNSIGALPEDIDHSIEFLDENESYDSCQSVAEHNWHTPMRACTIDDDTIVPFIAKGSVKNSNDRAVLGDTYFFNGSFFVIRKKSFFDNTGFPFPWTGRRIKPIIQEQRYMELDSEWQKAVFKGSRRI